MYWYIQNKLVRQKAVVIQKMEEIIVFLSEIENDSIFVESHRVMTADQVLKTGCGNNISKALLAATLFNLAMEYSTAVFLTVQKAYCMIYDGNNVRCIEMPTGQEVFETCGLPLLLFDENTNIWFNQQTGVDFSLKKSLFNLKHSKVR